MFSVLPARDVAALVDDRFTEKLGVAVHFDGTRRWYLRTYGGACEHDLYNEDYVSKTMQRIRDISEMMFRDGVTALYLPALGKRIEVERGPQYARFQADSLTHALLEEDMLEFCRGLGIRLSCYGGVERLATRLERELRERQDVAGVERYMRWGVFAVAVQPGTTCGAVRWWMGVGVPVYPGRIAAGSQGPVVNSWVSASNASMPHLAAVER